MPLCLFVFNIIRYYFAYQKELDVLWDYYGYKVAYKHDIARHKCSYARLLFLKSGFFVFSKEYFQVVIQYLAKQAVPTVVVAKGENNSLPLRTRREVRI